MSTESTSTLTDAELMLMEESLEMLDHFVSELSLTTLSLSREAEKLRAMLQAKIPKRPSSVPTLALGTTPRPKHIVMGQGFLWKPEGDHSKKAVVLLPTNLRGLVRRCYLTQHRWDVESEHDSYVIEKGVFAGDQANGERPHYRFEKPGAAYGTRCYVVARTQDGAYHTRYIKDCSLRVT